MEMKWCNLKNWEGEKKDWEKNKKPEQNLRLLGQIKSTMGVIVVPEGEEREWGRKTFEEIMAWQFFKSGIKSIFTNSRISMNYKQDKYKKNQV